MHCGNFRSLCTEIKCTEYWLTVKWINKMWKKMLKIRTFYTGGHLDSSVYIIAWLRPCIQCFKFLQIMLQKLYLISKHQFSVTYCLLHKFLLWLLLPLPCLYLRLSLVSSCFTVQAPQLQILPAQIAAPAGLNEIKPFCSHVITPKSRNGCGSEFV